MQRDIMKHRVDAVPLLSSCENGLAINIRRKQKVVHVPVVLAIGGDDGTAKQALLLERCEHVVIAVPEREPRMR